MNISDWIVRHATFVPDKPAIRFDGRDISYRAFAQAISDIAAVLHHKLGIERGDRVCYLGFNHPDQLALLFACARIGAILSPLNWRLEAGELRHLCDKLRPSAFFAQPEFLETAREACTGRELGNVVLGKSAGNWAGLETLVDDTASPMPDNAGYDDPALICWTSGTTGEPKGAVLTQNALFYNALNSQHMHDMRADDVLLNTLPMFHVGGLNVYTLPALHRGATVMFDAMFDVDATFDAIAAGAVTLLVLVPTQIVAMRESKRWRTCDFSPLRTVTTGSTLIPDSVVAAIHEKGTPIIQVYGSTETAPLASYLMAGDSAGHASSAGKPALHAQVRIAGDDGDDATDGVVGEVLVRGPNVMREYWEAPEATAAALRDGWFATGDIGHFDADGFLHIDDRKKDMIITGGENVFPAELENLLAGVDDIREAAVVGEPDDYWGERVVAVIVPAQADGLSEGDVQALFKGRIARYKIPRRVVFADALPRNAMGKVVKEEVRALVAAAPAENSPGGRP